MALNGARTEPLKAFSAHPSPVSPPRFPTSNSAASPAMPAYRTVKAQGAVQRSCFSGLMSWLGSCCGPNSAPYTELELEAEESQLADWGNATSLGYHKTAHWNDIKRSGQFKPGGGQFGVGWYLVASDGSWVSSTYRALTVWLEVGYVGDTSNWVVHTAESMLGFEESDNYDVIKTKNQEGISNQIVYKPNGPSHIMMQNFRVRKTRSRG